MKVRIIKKDKDHRSQGREDCGKEGREEKEMGREVARMSQKSSMFGAEKSQL